MSTNKVEVAVGRPSLSGRILYGVIHAILDAFTRTYWRLEVVGGERIPDNGGVVLAPVHRSNLDFLMPALATPRRCRWMAKHTIFKGGLVDRFLMSCGAFPVKRDTADRTSLQTCEALLAAGEPVVMFPEGRRKDGERVVDLFDGPAFVACRERVPIVPIGIAGSDKAMPIGSKMLFPRKIVLVVGEPIYPDVALEGRVPRSTVAALTADLQVELQRLYDEARRLQA